jgi:hypothetical protein
MMYPENIRIEPSKKEPWTILEPGRIFIMGRSIAEDPGIFYHLIYDWITKYFEDRSENTKIKFGFEYINTSSIKWIYNILKKLSEMEDIARRAKITWYYEEGDEDMCDLGLILRGIISCPFTLIEVDEMQKDRYEQLLENAL